MGDGFPGAFVTPLNGLQKPALGRKQALILKKERRRRTGLSWVFY